MSWHISFPAAVDIFVKNYDVLVICGFYSAHCIRVVKVFAMGVITRDFTMFLRAGKNTFGHGNKWQKLNFGIGWVLSAIL